MGNFQRHGQYDFVIGFLWKVKELFSFNYRKPGGYEKRYLIIINILEEIQEEGDLG